MQKLKHQDGFYLTETVVTLLLFAVIALGITQSSMLSIQVRNRSLHNSTAMQIALESLESFVGIDPSILSDTNDSSTTVNRDNLNFTRVVNITVNSDSSRTVSVTVTDSNLLVGAHANVENTFPLWGSQ